MAIFGGKKNKDDQAPAPQVEEKKAEVKKDDAVVTESVASVISSVSPSRSLLRPRITEKASLQMEKGIYVFEVHPKATKQEISKGIEEVYKVTPTKINIVKMRPQRFISRMRGNRRGMKSGYKKAYVHLKDGDRIELL